MTPITDYASLQSAIAGVYQRPNDPVVTENLALFIQLAEMDLYDRMLLRESETETNLQMTPGLNYVGLPVGYVRPIALWIVIDGVRSSMVHVSPEQLSYDTDATIPTYWAIDGPNIRFDCPAQEAYTAPFRYFGRTLLSDAIPTNYLLDRRPDIYLYGALKQCCILTEDDAGLAKYATLYEAAIRSMANAESQSRRVPLRTGMPRTDSRPSILKG